MKKEFIEVGKTVGTHGVRGMVRIQPWADNSAFLCGFETFYSGELKTPLKVEKIQPHGNIVIAKIKGTNSVEQAEKLRNEVLFVKRSDIKIPHGRYFVSELIGCRVFDAFSKTFYGVISDVSKTGANDVWHITKDGKEYLLPAIDEVVKRVDTEKEEVEICPMKGIFEDEN